MMGVVGGRQRSKKGGGVGLYQRTFPPVIKRENSSTHEGALRKDENMFSGQCLVAERHLDVYPVTGTRVDSSSGLEQQPARIGATLPRRLVRISFTRCPKHVNEGQQMFDAGGRRVYLHRRDLSGSREVTHIKTFVGCQT